MLSPEEPSGNSHGCSQVKSGPGQRPPKERSQVRDHRPQARLRSMTVLGGSGSHSRTHRPICGPSLSARNHVTMMDRTPQPRHELGTSLSGQAHRSTLLITGPEPACACSLPAPQLQPGAQTQGVRTPHAHPCPPPIPIQILHSGHPPPPAAWDKPFSPALGPYLTTPALGRSAPSRHGTASSSRGPHPQEPPQPRAHITHQDSQEPGLSRSPPAPAHRPPDSPSHHVHWAGKLLTLSQASALTPSRPEVS